jgi:protoporphyrinogen oxidase
MRICILGAGIAGLNAAFLLRKEGFDVDVYEQLDEVGGLASSFDFGGLKVERFYHFICGMDDPLFERAKDVGVFDKIVWKESQTGSFTAGQYYPFSNPLDLLQFSPVSLWGRWKFAWHILQCKKRTSYEDLESLTAKEWLLSSIGKQAYEMIWEPLLKIKFGHYHEEISASWIWHRIHRVANSRKGLLSNEKFGFFEEGSSTILFAIKDKCLQLGVNLKLSCGIQEIQKKDNRFSILAQNEQTEMYDKVVSTLPLSLLERLLKLEKEDESFRERLKNFSYIGIVCMILKMKRKISPSYWLNIHDKRIPFNGIIEYSNLKPCPNPEEHIAYIPYYIDPSEERYSYTDEKLFEEYLKAIELISPGFQKSDIMDYRVFREPRAQAICGRNFGQKQLLEEEHLGGLYISDSTQLYPEDRSLSGMIRVSNTVVDVLLNVTRESPPYD